MYSKCCSSEADGSTSLFCFLDPHVNGSHYNYCQQWAWHREIEALGNNLPEVFSKMNDGGTSHLNQKLFLVLSALLLQELLPWQRGRDLCFSVSCRVDLQCGRELWEAVSTRFRRVLYFADQVLGVAVGPVTGLV